MATFNHIGGAEPSTLTFKAATVTQTRNSSAMHQELISLADPESSLGIAAVRNVSPASTAWGLAVRIVSGPSTATDFAVRALLSSTAADNPVSLAAMPANSSLVEITKFPAGLLSTAAPASNSSGLNVWLVNQSTIVTIAAMPAGSTTVSVAALPANSSKVEITTFPAGFQSTSAPAANSTGLNVWVVNSSLAVSSVGGVVHDHPASTLWASSAGFHFDSSGALLIAGSFSAAFSSTKADNLVTVYQSSAADLNVTVAGYSTIVTVAGLPANSSKVEITTFPSGLVSTSAPSSGSSGIVVRQVLDAILTTASTNGLAGSTALSIQSSGAALRSYVTAYSIMSTNGGPVKLAFYSGATMTWPVIFAAVSSAVSGANLAVFPYLFRTAAADALTLNIKGTTLAGIQVAVSYYRAP